MPNGTTHLRLWKAGVAPVALGCVVSLAQSSDPQKYLTVTCVFLGYLMGYAVDPDMDMMTNTRSKKIWKSHWFLLPLYPWWLAYSWVANRYLGGHRSIMTHLPGLSSGLRMAWLGLPLLILTMFLGFTWVSVQSSYSMYLIQIAFGIWIGLSLSDTIHFVADLIRKD
jgi:uncharacterized metal-binding protein